jgi:LysR family glycine cleavage system transcriptional activator
LSRFEALFPDIRISITVGVGMSAPPSSPYDLAIIWGRGGWKDCRYEPLMTNTVFPVAAPDYFRALDRAPQLSDIPENHLIHDQTRFWWRAFRDAIGDRGLNPEAGRIYNRSRLCLEAAVRGHGVTIGDEVSTLGHLENGSLVCPFDAKLPSPEAYFLVRPKDSSETEVSKRFTEWLASEVEEHRRFFQAYWRRKKRRKI